MPDRNHEEDDYGSIALLDRTASPQPTSAAIAGRLRRPASPVRVALTDPAVSVMTDFSRDAPVTVAADRFIDDALRDMMIAGVRALLVMRGELVVGLITSYDIQGERPLQFLNGSGLTRHSEIEVGHVMTPWHSVQAIDVPWVCSASVGDVIERFRRRPDSHFVVVEYTEHGSAYVRGMFSRTELQRHSGNAI